MTIFKSKMYSALIVLIAVMTFVSCKKDTPLSNLAGITSFSIKELQVPFTVDEVMQKISNVDSLPFGTDVSKLTAVFTAVPKSKVMVGSAAQQSGTTVNNFTSPVKYTVVAENGNTTREYNVVVNVAKVDPKTIAWQQLTPETGWGNFHTNSTTYMGDKLYMIGGTMGSFGAFYFTSNVSTDGIAWTRTRAVDNNGDSVPKVEHPAFLTFNNKLWLLGGHRPGVGFSFDDVTNKVWSSADGLSWTADAPADPSTRWSKRERIESVVFNSKLWVIGGNDYPPMGNTEGPGTSHNDVWSSVDGTAWTQVTAGAAFVARTNPAVFVYDNKMWVVGGRDMSKNYLNDVWNSSDGNTWTQVNVTTPFTGRIAPEVVVDKDRIILVGGENNDGVLGDMWVSEDKGVTWTKVESGNVMALPGSFKPRKDFSMFVKSGSIYIVGGLGTKDVNTGKYPSVNDVWVGKLQ